jgi:hypothetical protein
MAFWEITDKSPSRPTEVNPLAGDLPGPGGSGPPRVTAFAPFRLTDFFRSPIPVENLPFDFSPSPPESAVNPIAWVYV